ncbi:MAG: undecaprenyl diphosphate synthase family protein [Epulopiscium sp.]|jgi:undecaprenyl diphosphate synthase|nr:undecaprenyl diphosphate synthase family protein [Candidatus Epulonipiscium sp.]
MRMPKHIGIIPDGNRRWAVQHGMGKEHGYAYGLNPGISVFKLCQELGVEELTFYGFTVDNTKRPTIQREKFTDACVEAVKMLSKENAELLVIGNSTSKMFPPELLEFTTRRTFGKGGMRVNFLVNYSWEWDLGLRDKTPNMAIRSQDISRVDLVIRWGGRNRLSGFLPIQSVYSDFYFIDELWPDYQPEHLYAALKWYQVQDITLGG